MGIFVFGQDSHPRIIHVRVLGLILTPPLVLPPVCLSHCHIAFGSHNRHPLLDIKMYRSSVAVVLSQDCVLGRVSITELKKIQCYGCDWDKLNWAGDHGQKDRNNLFRCSNFKHTAL
jgi:hypothetical protein